MSEFRPQPRTRGKGGGGIHLSTNKIRSTGGGGGGHLSTNKIRSTLNNLLNKIIHRVP